MSKKRIAGNRKRAFRIRSSEVPDVVHILMQHLHDLCMDLGVCPSCMKRLLHTKDKYVYSKCKVCLEYYRNYNKNRKRS